MGWEGVFTTIIPFFIIITFLGYIYICMCGMDVHAFVCMHVCAWVDNILKYF